MNDQDVEPQGQARAARSAETLLLVEDDADMREIEVETLCALGYDVLSAGDGPEALELATRHPGAIDLLVTDIVMPGMNGWDLATRMQVLRPRMRTLFVSGFAGDVIAGRRVPVGVRLLRKPFTGAGLASSVREALAESATRSSGSVS